MSVVRRRHVWLLMIAGVVVLGFTATTVSLLSTQYSAGLPRPAPSGERDRPEPREFAEVLRVAREETPKSEGFPADPEPTAMELRGDSLYVAYHTDTTVRVTAAGLDGEIRWTGERVAADTVSSVSLVATPAALVVVIDYQQAVGEFLDAEIVALDLSTGDVKWEATGNPTHFVGGLMITNRDGADNAYDVATLDKAWSLPDPGGSFSTFFEQSWRDVEKPDQAAPRRGIQVNRNEADDQYVVMANLTTGAARVVDLAAGAARAEGNLGDVNSVVAVEDTIYVHGEETGVVTAYAADDLSTARWRVTVPPTDRGVMWACGRRILCVSLDDAVLILISAAHGRELSRIDTAGAEIRQPGTHLLLARGGGTDLVDTGTGQVRRPLTAPVVAHAGDDLVIAGRANALYAHDPGRDEDVDLGPAPDPAVLGGECDWGRTVVLCAGETEYVAFRYRG